MGGLAGGLASITGHFSSGYSSAGLLGTYVDGSIGFSFPAYQGPVGAGSGALFGAGAAAIGFEEAGPVLSTVGVGLGAAVGGTAGGFAAIAGTGVTEMFNSLLARAGCGGE